jgi:hypothetical protein
MGRERDGGLHTSASSSSLTPLTLSSISSAAAVGAAALASARRFAPNHSSLSQTRARAMCSPGFEAIKSKRAARTSSEAPLRPRVISLANRDSQTSACAPVARALAPAEQMRSTAERRSLRSTSTGSCSGGGSSKVSRATAGAAGFALGLGTSISSRGGAHAPAPWQLLRRRRGPHCRPRPSRAG